jgi:hypothetical protein
MSNRKKIKQVVDRTCPACTGNTPSRRLTDEIGHMVEYHWPMLVTRRRETGWSDIPDDCVSLSQDPALSLTAKGLYGYLLSLDDWPSAEELGDTLPDDPQAIKNALGELTGRGLVELEDGHVGIL